MHDTPQFLLQHLKELRQRIVWVIALFIPVFVVCYTKVKFFYELLIAPLPNNKQLIYTNLPEAFLNELHVAFFFACLITLPFFLIQIWLFIKPALYIHEKNILHGALIAIPLFFYCGGIFAQYIVLPKAIQFFMSFEANETLIFLPKLSDYIGFYERLILTFGIGFELPIVLSTLVLFNIISFKTLKSRWRIVVFCLCAISAIITPPDALSMLALAIPLIALYVLTILMIQYAYAKKLKHLKTHHA